MSGIGPRSELQKHGINQALELPVGQNLQDHCLVYAGVRIGKPDGQMTLDALGLLNPLHLAQFYKMGSGPWSSNGLGVAGVMQTQLKKLRRRPGNYVF